MGRPRETDTFLDTYDWSKLNQEDRKSRQTNN